MKITILNDIQLETRGEPAFILKSGNFYPCELSNDAKYVRFNALDDEGNSCTVILNADNKNININKKVKRNIAGKPG